MGPVHPYPGSSRLQPDLIPTTGRNGVTLGLSHAGNSKAQVRLMPAGIPVRTRDHLLKQVSSNSKPARGRLHGAARFVPTDKLEAGDTICLSGAVNAYEFVTVQSPTWHGHPAHVRHGQDARATLNGYYLSNQL